MREAYQSQIDIEQNELMKLFTVVTVIFQPLTLLVGWYGMNFSGMPELAWKYGYPVFIIVSAVIVLILILYFKKKKWVLKEERGNGKKNTGTCSRPSGSRPDGNWSAGSRCPAGWGISSCWDGFVRPDKQFLISRRSPEKTNPLRWETTGGAKQAGEDSLKAVIREIGEELGVDVSHNRPCLPRFPGAAEGAFLRLLDVL